MSEDVTWEDQLYCPRCNRHQLFSFQAVEGRTVAECFHCEYFTDDPDRIEADLPLENDCWD